VVVGGTRLVVVVVVGGTTLVVVVVVGGGAVVVVVVVRLQHSYAKTSLHLPFPGFLLRSSKLPATSLPEPSILIYAF